MEENVTRLTAIALAAGIWLPNTGAGQLPEAEDAFRRGDYRAARIRYERVLAQDSTNVRALYRLAILDSWDGELDQSLARLTVLRRLEPSDGDFMVAQARVLSWAGRNREAEALYDSVLGLSPRRADALAGRARAVAWSGELDRAERLWREAVGAHPDDAETLIGLAQTLWWRGQPALAEAYVARARKLAPEDRTARDLERQLRAALRPEVSTTADYAHDSDDNAFFAQDGSFTASLGTSLRGTVTAGWRHATDPIRSGNSYGVGGYVIAALHKGAVLRAGLGAQRLEPGNAPSRTPLTAELGLGLRPDRYASVGIAYSRRPFDETALLIDSGYVLDGLDLSVDVSPTAAVSLSGGGGVTWLSDGNRRISGAAAVLVSPARGVQAGVFGRMMGYRLSKPGLGYFAPDRFSLFEGRAAWTWRRERWGVRGDAGLGLQEVGTGAETQTEWHVGVALARGWNANNELALLGSVTNSVASSQTGAPQFTYWTVGLRLRQGL